MSEFDHTSGVLGAYDRTIDPTKMYSAIIFIEGSPTRGVFVQGAELNEMQSLLGNRLTRVGDLVGADGDRIAGGDAKIDTGLGTIDLSEGHIYAKGDVRRVAAKALTAVPMIGEISIGVRITSTVVTHVEDPDLLGLEPGSLAEGEPGAAREVETVSWGFEGDGQSGALYQVYLLKDGVIVDSAPPPYTSGVVEQIARYDVAAHGNYVVEGCQVFALGLISGAQVFTIGKGQFNVLGYKIHRDSDMRHSEIEAPTLEVIENEARTFADGGSGTAVIGFYHTPVDHVTDVTVEKQITLEVVTKGISGSQDALSQVSVKSLVLVKQGGTTYVAGTDYILTADKIDWSPAGAEPLSGSTYEVTYRYYANVPPGVGGYSNTAAAITIPGGVTGGDVLLEYAFKQPRIDLLCLNSSGLPVYVVGESDRTSPVPPTKPLELLELAEIHNTWGERPLINYIAPFSIPFFKQHAKFNQAEDTRLLLGIEMQKSEHKRFEPVAEYGSFADGFQNDVLRDAGATQTAALIDGEMVLGQTVTVHDIDIGEPNMLDHTHEIVVTQDKSSYCQKINPYAVVDPLPGEMKLKPESDFYAVHETRWVSEETRIATGVSASTQETVEIVGSTERPLPFMRQATVNFSINGFNAGEELTTLTFDNISVLPGVHPVANASGAMSGSFVVPANVSAGTKRVFAQGHIGSKARANYTGNAELIIESRRAVTTITRPLERQDWSGKDPLAQSFQLQQGRYISGVDLQFCTKGNAAKGVTVELVTMLNGYPTTRVFAQSHINMATVVLNQWTFCEFATPVWVPANVQFAFVIKTNDTVHSVRAAAKGQIDTATGRTIASQPYVIGVMFSSSNAVTWTAHQNNDIAFRLKAAKFLPLAKTIDYGQIAVTNMSDIKIAAATEVQTEAANVVFEIERPNGKKHRLRAGQPLAFDTFITESIRIRAILSGSSTVTPIIYPALQVLTSQIKSSGTYICRAFTMGTAIKLASLVHANLPAGSTLAIHCDAADDNWQALTLIETVPQDDGFSRLRHQRNPFTAALGRVRLTITGTPSARPKLKGLNAHALVP